METVIRRISLVILVTLLLAPFGISQVPSISSLTPSSAIAGGAGFSLIVTGTNFLPGSIVHWNASASTTTFLSSTQLRATITASDIASPGTIPVTVVNPGGISSFSKPFAVTVATNPIPVIASITPSAVEAGGPGFALSVIGTGFIPGFYVQRNGVEITFVPGHGTTVERHCW